MTQRLAIPSTLLGALTCGVLACSTLACGDDGPGGDGSTGSLTWYQTCGDPVCSSYDPTPGATVCTGQMVGSGCATAGDSCEIPDDDCNADLLCADADPADNCPISQRRHKRDIHYLTRAERARLADEVLATRLATYRYRTEPGRARPRLGFIIDDRPESPAVAADGARVDLYGYASMTVAALQSQAETIAALRAELAELRAEVDLLRRVRAGESGEPSGR